MLAEEGDTWQRLLAPLLRCWLLLLLGRDVAPHRLHPAAGGLDALASVHKFWVLAELRMKALHPPTANGRAMHAEPSNLKPVRNTSSQARQAVLTGWGLRDILLSLRTYTGVLGNLRIGSWLRPAPYTGCSWTLVHTCSATVG